MAVLALGAVAGWTTEVIVRRLLNDIYPSGAVSGDSTMLEDVNVFAALQPQRAASRSWSDISGH